MPPTAAALPAARSVHALTNPREVAGFFGFDYDEDPAPDGPITPRMDPAGTTSDGNPR
jgi:hypothetical protein